MKSPRWLRVGNRYRLTCGFAVGAIIVLIVVSISCWRVASVDPFAQPFRTLNLDDAIRNIAISPDGKTAAATMSEFDGNKEFVRRWSLPNGEGSNHYEYQSCVGYAPTGNRVAYSSWNGIHVVDRNSNAELLRLSGLGIGGGIADGAFSPDGNWLAVRDNASCIHLWELNKGIGSQSINVSSGAAGFAFAPNGEEILVVRRTTECETWKLAAFRNVATTAPLAANDICVGCAVSANNGMLAVATTKRILVWDMARQKIIATIDPAFSSNASPPMSMCFTADSGVLVAVAYTGRLTIHWQPGFPYLHLSRLIENSEVKAFEVGSWKCAKAWRCRNWANPILPLPGGRDLISPHGQFVDIWRWDDL